jgi:DNA (cytosine-5)-methyltransferase 1
VKEQLNELALFAGAGGGILGGHLLGWRTVCAVEWEPYPASVLCARQNDGLLPPFPIWDDVQTFDGKPWRGIVDVVSGGFPCQDISAAGKGTGIDGERSGMWREMARIICEVQPRFAFVENSPMLTSRGLGTVLGDLASMGFDAKWGVLGAADVGANHQRDRIWIVAKWRGQLSHAQHNRIGRWEQQQKSSEKEDVSYSSNNRFGKRQIQHLNWQFDQASNISIDGEEKSLANTYCTQLKRNQCTKRIDKEYPKFGSSGWWEIEPNILRVADGVAARVDRIKAIGNGQVPLCAATAWQLLSK